MLPWNPSRDWQGIPAHNGSIPPLQNNPTTTGRYTAPKALSCVGIACRADGAGPPVFLRQATCPAGMETGSVAARKPAWEVCGRCREGIPRSSLFGSIEKRRPRYVTQQIDPLCVFCAIRARKAAKRHEDGVSCRRGRAAGGPEPRPRVPDKLQTAPADGLTAALWAVGFQAKRRLYLPSHRDCDTENDPKATASCSRQNSLNTYRLFSSGLMFVLGS